MKRYKQMFFLLFIAFFVNLEGVVHAETKSSESKVQVEDTRENRRNNLEKMPPLPSTEEESRESNDTDAKSIETTINETVDTIESSQHENAADQHNKQSTLEKNSPLLAANEIEVSSWDDFVKAVRDETITKILIIADFENPKATDSQISSYLRKNDLEIDGGGHRVDFKSSSIQLGSPTNTIGLFHLHDIVLSQKYNVTAASEDIVGTRLNYINGAKWKYRFGNITTEPGVQRLARASHGEVTVYGNMMIDTRAENFYLGSLIMEDGTEYHGNVNEYDFSVFWYNVTASATSTGASREFTIGKNCRVDVGQTQTAGRAYPAVFAHYLSLTVGENSVYNVNMPGNAVRFNDENSGMVIKPGAIVNLTSKQASGSVLAFSNDNTYFTAEPGSYFYVIGTSNQPLINLAADYYGTSTISRKNNAFTLNSPAQYDLRNLDDSQPAVRVAYGNEANNSFLISNSDIDLWKVGVPVLGPSSETYAKIPLFSVTGSGTKEVVTTDTPSLSQFKQTNYRRISGINQDPTIEWSTITDADKTITGRVKIGEVPDNNGLVAGKINYIPVYASEDQAKVTLTDTFGIIRDELSTDENGYIYYTDSSDPIQFQKAGKIISGIAERGQWRTPSPIETTVIDATPPEPVKVDRIDAIHSTTKTITGIGEANSLLTLTVNDQLSGIPPQQIGSDGKWTLDISSLQLAKGDLLQFFLQDQSGLITQLSETERPSTNDTIGNINPKTDLSFRDALFKAATKAVVGGDLSLVSVPEGLDFGDNLVSNHTGNYQAICKGELVISDTRGAVKKPWRLTLAQSEELRNVAGSLSDGLYYTSQLGEKQVTKMAQIVESGEFTADGEKNISSDWHNGNGFRLTVPVEKQRIGDYSGKLLWQLEDVPGN